MGNRGQVLGAAWLGIREMIIVRKEVSAAETLRVSEPTSETNKVPVVQMEWVRN